MADYTTVLTGGTNNFATTSEHLNYLATDILSDGVVGSVANTAGVAPMTGGLAVNAQGSPNMTVAATAGVCYVTATPSGQASQRLRANIAGQNVTISANSTGGTRYDWVYVKIDAANAANPNAAGDNVATLVTSRSTSSNTDNGTPPTYGDAIAIVTVANGATSITNGNISDSRVATSVPSSTSSDGWTTLGSTPNTVTANGNRNYDLVFNSVDLTSTLSPGMKLKATRTVAAPSKCTDLESGSSQYYSKTTPAGLTFTDDFTCSAWVKLESYTAGGIIARRNADTEGFSLSVNATGQVLLGAYRIAGNNAVVSSYASLPLNKWVHVAASYDLSGTTAAVYFDGVAVTSLKTVTGTCTALVQGTTALVVGAEKSAGTNPFDGKIAQAAIFSSVLSAATIKAMCNQTLAGTESTLVSAYSFNNVITDLNTTTANNLTASGGAVATDSDSPYANAVTAGTLEYAEINSVVFSTNTTVNVRVPDTSILPTSGGVSAVSYSTQSNPYGLPAFSNIIGYAMVGTAQSTASTSRVAVNGLSVTVIIPPGRKIKLSQYTRSISGTTGDLLSFEVHDGSVSGSTNIVLGSDTAVDAGGGPSIFIQGQDFPNLSVTTHTTKTYVGGINNNTAARTATFAGELTSTFRRPMYLMVELI